ncbi:unnamed protein product [Caenorhabditis brenneri]
MTDNIPSPAVPDPAVSDPVAPIPVASISVVPFPLVPAPVVSAPMSPVPSASLPVVRQPVQLMGFFVPMNKAAYVTELLELALGSTPGVTVQTAIFNKTPSNVLAAESETDHLDSDALPCMDTSDMETLSTNPLRKRKIKRRGRKPFNPRKATKKRIPEIAISPVVNGGGMLGMAQQLEQKYGTSNTLPYGNLTTPQLLIQYPQLPFPVPVHPDFNNLGVPRNVVQLGINDLLTPAGELMPLGRSNATSKK